MPVEAEDVVVPPQAATTRTIAKTSLTLRSLPCHPRRIASSSQYGGPADVVVVARALGLLLTRRLAPIIVVGLSALAGQALGGRGVTPRHGIAAFASDAWKEVCMTTEMRVAVEPVCSLPPGCFADAITADGHVLAFCAEPDGRIRFVWDGVAGVPFDRMGELRDGGAAVHVSADGAHVAYEGLRSGLWFVGRDRTEDRPVERLTRSVPPTFGGGGRHLAYGAHLASGDVRLIVDGEPVGSGSLAPFAAVFSPDGERLAYMEMRGDGRKGTECRIILDGEPGEWFAGTRNAPGAMQFSPDGRRFAYMAIDGKGHLRWFVDGVGQRLVNEVATLSLSRLRGVSVLEPPLAACFSPDSRRFAYFADVVEKGVAIIEDDVPGPLFKAVGRPVFSPDSLHLAYVAQTYLGKTVLVVDGEIASESPATGAGEPAFSADSQRIALTTERETGGFLRKRKLYSLTVDGRTFPEEPGHDVSLKAVFSPDGMRVAWWIARDDDAIVFVDGVAQGGDTRMVSDFSFDAMGRIVFSGTVGGSQTVAVDGRSGPLADAVAPLASARDTFGKDPALRAAGPFRISADGAHVAWGGVFEGVARPVMDDEVGPAFDVIHECGFDDDGAAVWWAQRGEDVIRVRRVPEADPGPSPRFAEDHTWVE